MTRSAEKLLQCDDMDSLNEKFEEIDLLIKGNQWERAQKLLTSLKRKVSDRRDLVKYASLCRRADIPGLGLSALKSLVLVTSRKSVGAATVEEQTEYAACLCRIGAHDEAKTLLREIGESSHPAVLSLLANLHVKEWNYQLAIPLLRKYVAHEEVTAYDRCVGLLNLGLCLTFEEKLREATSLLLSVSESEEARAYPLVAGNAFRLLGIIDYNKENFETANDYFEKSLSSFLPSNSLDRFLVQKWMALTNYFLHKGNEESRKQLNLIKKEALERKHWESIRDIEYQIAVYEKDKETILRLYHGSPYKPFRDRIHKKFPNLQLPALYPWSVGEQKDSKKGILFDLQTSGLKPGQGVYRLLALLASDFYRPFPTISIFDKLFPGSHYTYGHSEQRVYQGISRARRWLKKNGIPLEIDPAMNESRLIALSPCTFIVRLGHTEMDQNDHRLLEIYSKVGKQFSTKQAIQVLGLSKRTLVSLVNRGLETGELTKVGSGTATRYAFNRDPEDFKKAS